METIEVIPLGGGCEVGRSCILFRIKGKAILFDCGIHPSDTDLSCLPFFDKIDMSEIDCVLITHFHLDHCGAVPYLLSKTNYKGLVYMTYPTKAIYKYLLLDSLKINESQDKLLFTKEDVTSSLQKIIPINFHEQQQVGDIKFRAYNAGHVVGAAMFLVEVSSIKVLYTGDYSREEDIHIQPAEIPTTQIDILIVESTYGIKTHEPRKQRESYLLESVEKIVKRQGKCLLPVFVLGRSQEILLILEEYWEKKQELWQIPIYFPSQLLAKCMMIFQTYVNMMGRQIREKLKNGQNPFDFKHVVITKGLDQKENQGVNNSQLETINQEGRPVVVMASPGMLQKGLSRTLFYNWCQNERNGVIFTGYCVENTLAWDILSGKEVRREGCGGLQIKCSVDQISFSAHADYDQTREFIEQLRPKLVVLVHGEKHEAFNLKKQLEENFGNTIRFEAPRN